MAPDFLCEQSLQAVLLGGSLHRCPRDSSGLATSADQDPFDRGLVGQAVLEYGAIMPTLFLACPHSPSTPAHQRDGLGHSFD